MMMTSLSTKTITLFLVTAMASSTVSGQGTSFVGDMPDSPIQQGACCAPLGTTRSQQDNICKGLGNEPSGLICVEEFCVDGTIQDSCCVIPCESDDDCPGEIHECRETGPTGNKRKGCTFGEFTDAFEKLCIGYPTPLEASFPQRDLGTCCNKIDEIMDKPTLQDEWCGSRSGSRICAPKFCAGEDCCAIPCSNNGDCGDGSECIEVDGKRACTFNGSSNSCKGGTGSLTSGSGGGGGGGGSGGSSSTTTSGAKSILTIILAVTMSSFTVMIAL